MKAWHLFFVCFSRIRRSARHKASHMTQRYAHHGPKSLRDGINVLNDSSIVRI
jgi:hypothetical protein